MAKSKITWESINNRGRRLWADRRNFSYYLHIPERRRGEDRRSNKDRALEESKQSIMGDINNQYDVITGDDRNK